MNIDPITTALIEICVFFGTCEDEIVDSDIAVEQLEHIASYLRLLNDEGKQRFLLAVDEYATQEELSNGATPKAEFLRSLSENLGVHTEN